MSGDPPKGGRIEDWFDVIVRLDAMVRAHVRCKGLHDRFGDADIEAVQAGTLRRIVQRAARVAAGQVEFRRQDIVVRYFIRKCVTELLQHAPTGGGRAVDVDALPGDRDPETILIRRQAAEANRRCLDCSRRALHALLETVRTHPCPNRTREVAILFLIHLSEDEMDQAARRNWPRKSEALRKELQRIRRFIREESCVGQCGHRQRRSR